MRLINIDNTVATNNTDAYYYEVSLALNSINGQVISSDAMSLHDWREFFGIRPCIMKEGKPVQYLPWEYEDPRPGKLEPKPLHVPDDIDGEVMIECQPRWFNIEQNGDLITVTVRQFVDYRCDETALRKIYNPAFDKWERELPQIFKKGTDNYGHPFYISYNPMKHIEECMSMYEYKKMAESMGDRYSIPYWSQWIYLQIINLFINQRADIDMSEMQYVQGLTVSDIDRGTVGISYPPACSVQPEYIPGLLFDETGDVISIAASGAGFMPGIIVDDRVGPNKPFYYYSGIHTEDGVVVGGKYNTLFMEKINGDTKYKDVKAHLMYF